MAAFGLAMSPMPDSEIAYPTQSAAPMSATTGTHAKKVATSVTVMAPAPIAGAARHAPAFAKDVAFDLAKEAGEGKLLGWGDTLFAAEDDAVMLWSARSLELVSSGVWARSTPLISAPRAALVGVISMGMSIPRVARITRFVKSTDETRGAYRIAVGRQLMGLFCANRMPRTPARRRGKPKVLRTGKEVAQHH
jgi:hypothetical protein